MTVVLVRCVCGAEQRLAAELVTLLIDLTEDRASVHHRCPLCGTTTETVQLDTHVQTALLDAGCQLAARGV